jgi:hypothetical protein
VELIRITLTTVSTEEAQRTQRKKDLFKQWRTHSANNDEIIINQPLSTISHLSVFICPISIISVQSIIHALAWCFHFSTTPL